MLDLLSQVKQHRIIVAVRGSPAAVLPTARALHAGGVRLLEVTFDQASPTALADTPAAIRQVREAMGQEMLVGAGTVLTAGQARAAVQAGAQYLLTPNLDLGVIEAAHALGVPVVPGAFTPTEITAAWNAGAALVKLLPAGSLGPSYIKALTAPLSHIPPAGNGRVDEKNLTEYLSLPCMAGVGIGSNIAKKALVEAGDFAALSALARRYTDQL